jgi:hypothetical protein
VAFSRPYFNQHQEPVPSSGNDTNHFALDPPGFGLPHRRNSGLEVQRDLYTTDMPFSVPWWEEAFPNLEASSTFGLWKRIHNETPQMLAESITKDVKRSLVEISHEHIAQHDRRVEAFYEAWSEFSDNILAFLIIDAGLAGYIMELTDVRRHPFNVQI